MNQLALRIGFDATSLEVLRVVGGSASTIDPKGQVALDTASPNGVSGTFATITFRAIDASPSSPVQVLSVRASNAGGRSIDVAVPGIAPMLINP